jgi:hypothetical protein
MNFLAILTISIVMFLCGYFLASYQKNKSIEIERGLATEEFIYSYCESLKRKLTYLLENRSPQEDTPSSHGGMAATIYNIHGDLMAWTTVGKEVFGEDLEGKISELMATANAIEIENSRQNLDLITTSLNTIEKIKNWLEFSYLPRPEGCIKMLAIEAYELMNTNEEFIKIIEDAITKHGDSVEKFPLPAGEAAVKRHNIQIKRYNNALEIMKNCPPGHI